MSYILDALRKSDQQRRHGTTPTLLTSHGFPAAPRRAAIVPYAVLAILLMAAGVAIGWLRPWQSGPQAPAAAVASPTVKLQPEQDRQSAPPMRALDTVSRTPPGPAAEARPEAAKQARPAIAAAESREASVPPAAAAAKDAAPGAAAANAPAAPGQSAASQEKAVTTLAELPAAIQQEIPRLAVSVHAYSAVPGNRLVAINDQMLREGDGLSPGLRLVEITEDGMIFSYKGYRFRTGTRGSASGQSRP